MRKLSVRSNGKFRADGWQNVVTGLGAANDKTRATSYSRPEQVTAESIEWLYDSDWLAARIVDGLVNASFRRGLIVSPEAGGAFDVLNYSEKYPEGAMQTALKLGRLLGGSALILGAKSGAPLDQPLPKRAEVAWLDVAKRNQLRAATIDQDPASATFKQALTIELCGNHDRSGLVFHRSRLILCDGRATASRDDAQWFSDSPIWQGFPRWGSVLQPVYAEIGRFGMVWTAVSHMIQEASIAVMRMNGVISMLAQQNESAIMARLALISASRSVAKTILLDTEGEEEYKREAVSFTDLPALLAQLSNQVAGAADMPATILFKYSPAGMNATGESDLTQWYDSVREYQTQRIAPKLRRLFSALAIDTPIEFAALSEPTEAEAAATRNARATGDQTYIQNGVLLESEVRKLRAEDGTLGIALDPAEATKPIPVEFAHAADEP